MKGHWIKINDNHWQFMPPERYKMMINGKFIIFRLIGLAF